MNLRRSTSTHGKPETVNSARRIAMSQQGPAIRLPEHPALNAGHMWLLRFAATPPGPPAREQPAAAPPDPLAGDANIVCLRISAISPLAVHWIRVCDGSRQVFQIDTLCRDGFRVTTAGELIEAIAQISGLTGMTIELPGRPLSAAGVMVDMRVQTGQAGCREPSAQVDAWMG